MAVQQLGKRKGKVATEELDWEQSREDCEERLRRQRIEWELQVQEQKEMFDWQSVTPYEGVSFCLECEDGLTIKDHMVFDNRGAYHVTRQADGRRIEITSSQWLNADTGFSVTISDTPLKKDVRIEEEKEPHIDGDASEGEDEFSLPPDRQRGAIKW